MNGDDLFSFVAKMPLKNQILRHPSNVESRGFLGLNRRWNSRPASWAGASNGTVPGVVTGRCSDLSSVSAFNF